ncbi:MAG: ATP12 family chaperone protein, partial [Deltaproteobacteria bacterium]
MSAWAAKRFWTSTTIATTEHGWQVMLDERVLKTPGKLTLALPTKALAEAIAAEWALVDGVINPLRMPLTRLANTALEKVAPLRDEVIAEIAAYGGSDLLCYRASEPVELVARQSAIWDPYLNGLAATSDARLIVTPGVIPVEQPATAVENLRAEIAKRNAFGLTCLYEMTAISGS